jgi:predicted transposase YdaD
MRFLQYYLNLHNIHAIFPFLPYTRRNISEINLCGLYQVGSKNTQVSCCWLWFFKLVISTSLIKMGVFETFPITILTQHDTVTILRHQQKKIISKFVNITS